MGRTRFLPRVKPMGFRAVTAVTVTGPGGRIVTYLFELSLQSTGTFRDCWTTDSVTVE